MTKILKFRKRNLNIRNQKIPSKSNKFIILLCVLMIALPFFTFTVSAGDVVIEDFDSYGEGVGSGSNTFVSWYGDSVTSSSVFRSSPLSLRTKLESGNEFAYVNLHTNTSMGGFEIWIRYTASLSSTYLTISLKNDTGSEIIRFKLNWWSTQDWYVYDYDTDVKLCDARSHNNWWCVGFQGNHSEGNPLNYVYYYVKNSDGDIIYDLEKRWISTEEYVDVKLSQIILTTTATSSINEYSYFDDITMTDYIPPEYEYEGDFDFESTDNIGNLDTACTLGTGNLKGIEFKYHVPVTINATGFDLVVDSTMHRYDDVLTNYDLYINGEFMGTPTEWKEYGNNYVLRWEFISAKVIENSEILYEIWHDVGTPIQYWMVGVGCNRADMDKDNWALMKNSNTYPNGAFDGTVIVYDVAYQIYFDDIQFPDDETYYDNDYISVIDEIHYCGEPVWLTYTLTNMASDTYLRIWNDDTSVEVNDGVFPYICPTTSETMGFVAETSANYTASLNRSSVELDNVSFFVNDFKNPTNYVYTMPNPSFEGKPYLVKYAFDSADAYDGAIFLSNTPDYRNYYEIRYILDGESGSYTQIQNAPCTLYFILAVDKNGTYYVTDNGIHQHTVKSTSMINSFTLGASHLTLEDGLATQSVTGETTHMGGNCRIYDNGKLVYTITETPFSEYYTITTAGDHKVEMRLVTNETIVLYTQTYTVSGVAVEDEVEDTSYILHDWAYDSYGEIGVFIAGICVVLGFMFIPFGLVIGVNVKFNKNIALGDLHWSIYLIFAIVGVIVDVQLHLAELWIILIVCVVAISITVISWNSRS